jgi:hypothetical protein
MIIWNKKLSRHYSNALNSVYSGGRDQGTHSSKPAWTNSSQDPVLKKSNTHTHTHTHTHKKAGEVSNSVDSEFKP